MKSKHLVFISFTSLFIVIAAGHMTWSVLLPRYANKKHTESSALRETGRLYEALSSINSAIFFKPSVTRYYTDRALIYWLLAKRNPGDTRFVHLSKIDWNKALELEQTTNPKQSFGNIYYGLALAEHKLGETDQSIVNYQKAYEYTSDPVRKSSIASILGHILFTSKDYIEAGGWFDKVSEGDPDYFNSCMRNALSNHRLNNFKRAEKLYLNALSLQPDNGHLNIYISHLYAEVGEQTKVTDYLKHGLDQLEDVGLVFATLGNDNFTSEPWGNTEYLELYGYFFKRLQDELRSYATGDFPEDSLEIKKLNAFYRSVKKVVVRSLDNPNREVSGYAQTLLTKIKSAGLYKDEEGVKEGEGVSR